VRVPLKKLDISGNQQLGNQSLRGKRSRGANDFGDKSIIVCCGAAAFQTYLSRRAAVAASLLVWTFRGDELFYDYFLLLLGRLISIFLFSLLAYLGSSLYIYFIFPSMFVIWLNCCCCCCSQRWTITPVGIASSDLSSWQTSCVHFVSPPPYIRSLVLFSLWVLNWFMDHFDDTETGDYFVGHHFLFYLVLWLFVWIFEIFLKIKKGNKMRSPPSSGQIKNVMTIRTTVLYRLMQSFRD
jgi:hypothetical protein